MKYKTKEVEEAKSYLLSVIKPGDKIYGLLRHISSSGMTRHISLFIVLDDHISNITWTVGKILGYKIHNDGGLVVGGCGMDMVFHCIYELGSQLFGYGNNATSWKYKTGRNGYKGYETDGGYFLKKEIL